MGKEIPHRNETTWTNTGARTSPQAFYKPIHNQQIAIHELGGGRSVSGSTEQIGNMEELKREAGTKDSIKELKSLFRGQRVEMNSADGAKISCSLAGRIAKTMIYGNE